MARPRQTFPHPRLDHVHSRYVVSHAFLSLLALPRLMRFLLSLYLSIGAYHVYLAYYAWHNTPGYDFGMIPDLD